MSVTVTVFERRITDLTDALGAAAIPIDGVRVLNAASNPPQVEVQYKSTATGPQRSAGAALVAGFDWSPAADAASQTALQRTQATALLSSPDGAYKLLRAVGAALLDQLNTIRSLVPRGLVSITRTGTTATATAFLAHGLTTGEQVFIGGADVAAYNGAKTITVTSPTVFTFPVAGSPATPATGSISFVLGTVTSLEPITKDQVNTAILAKITAGLVDNGA